MRWIKSGSRLIAQGRINHKVWRAITSGRFYAVSGLDSHGPYKKSIDAIDACERQEKALVDKP